MARFAAVAVAAAAVTSACASGAKTNWLGDERWDLVNRPKGAIAVLGDSVGYGLTTVGNVTGRLSQDGWGPLRSYTQPRSCGGSPSSGPAASRRGRW
jgi:hypothetical protein